MHSHTVVIRARAATRDGLKELAEAEGATVIDTLERIVEREREAKLIHALGATLARDAEVIASEARDFEVTLSDGLDPSEDFSDW